ncbi:hypothetical protein BDK51DRAFT_35398 [Blyttiomyces helicus]|uniref:Uncharacterized protein n=1 Tax=Blyttiomyces helicus TaxID=388810 RepID=A0A4V1IQ93_9FUNG|nr:hypothetical protein BDK51DRAFT_35398 [Blyttiomyces helicus]|eukprot:RKO85757.1 hypothetical protein BDK51DRAFT_35398 [Blyttiomyces helicus]
MQESAACDRAEHGHEFEPPEETAGVGVMLWLNERRWGSSGELANIPFASPVVDAFRDLEAFDPYLFREGLCDVLVGFFDSAIETAAEAYYVNQRPRPKNYAAAAASAVAPSSSSSPAPQSPILAPTGLKRLPESRCPSPTF